MYYKNYAEYDKFVIINLFVHVHVSVIKCYTFESGIEKWTQTKNHLTMQP